MSELCRFDYVVQAVESLQEYLSTCASEGNTHQLVVDAHVAISELKRIEETLIGGRRIKRTAKRSIRSSIDEFSKISEDIGLRHSEVTAFLDDNKEAFDKVKGLSREMKEMAASIRSMESTCASMKFIKKRVDVRMNAIMKQVK